MEEGDILFYNRQRSKFFSVIGEAEGQVLLDMDTTLENPDINVKNPIIDEKFEIQDLQKFIFTGKVVIQGKLVKNIIYKAQDRLDFIAHKTVKKPFTMEISIPGLRRGVMVKNRLFFPNDPFKDIDIEILTSKFESVTNLSSDRLMIKDDQEKCDCPSRKKDALIIFKNPALARKYEHKCNYKIKDRRICSKRKKTCDKLQVHEKVLIRIFVVCSKLAIGNTLVCKPSPIFHCSGQIPCKVS